MNIWILTAVTTAAMAWSQPLGLEQALAIADTRGYGNQIAQARELAASGQRLNAWSGLVPSAHLEIGAAVTDDPLGAFASRLGQRRVSMASFDPANLNDPDLIPNLTMALIADVPLVNLDAWHGRLAAEQNFAAVQRATVWERNKLRAQVVESWFAVGLARDAVTTWETGLSVAKSFEQQAVSGQRNQIATRSDVLRAQVEVANLSANLTKARTDAVLAQKRLALLLGGSLPGVVPPIELTDSGLLTGHHPTKSTETSLEVAVIGLQSEAARANWCRTRDAFLPRLNGMVRVDWKERSPLIRHDPSWSLGVVASWNLPGAQSLGVEREARGRWREAQVGLEAMIAQQAMERDAERAKLASGMERLQIAGGSLVQVIEAHRIVSRRYDEGLATMTERIEAASLETQTRLQQALLRQEIVATLARLALLEGRDPAELALLSVAK